jgi:uncharacterized membrane protein YeaQ/YmgE (transglycosylase-associated protein family)
MDDLSQEVTQYPWNDEPKMLPWFPATILAGAVGGIVAPLVFSLLLRSSTVIWLAALLLVAQFSGWEILVFFHLLTSISGAIGGAAGGLIFYATRRKPLRRAARWSIVWAVIGLLGYEGSMIPVDWTTRLLSSIFGPTQLLLGFPIVGAALGVLTAAGLYVIDPDGEEYG